VIRDSMGFRGLLMSDDISMGLTKGTWPPAEVVA
jgi:beta-glucosidase-like glycosyl hydrolase